MTDPNPIAKPSRRNNSQPPEEHAPNRKAKGGKKAQGRAPDARDAPEKKLGRDEKGRWLVGASGNARGRPPITPEMKAVRALCEVEREANVAELVRLRNTSDDPWVQLEAIKMMLVYSDGKPVTALPGSGPLVAINIPVGHQISDPHEAARVYADIMRNPSADLSAITFAVPAPSAAVAVPAVDSASIVAEVPAVREAVSREAMDSVTSALPDRLAARIGPVPDDTAATWGKLA